MVISLCPLWAQTFPSMKVVTRHGLLVLWEAAQSFIVPSASTSVLTWLYSWPQRCPVDMIEVWNGHWHDWLTVISIGLQISDSVNLPSSRPVMEQRSRTCINTLYLYLLNSICVWAMGASLGVENIVCCTTRGDEAAARLVKNRLGSRNSTCKSCSCSLPVFLEILVGGMCQFTNVGVVSTDDMIMYDIYISYISVSQIVNHKRWMVQNLSQNCGRQALRILILPVGLLSFESPTYYKYIILYYITLYYIILHYIILYYIIYYIVYIYIIHVLVFILGSAFLVLAIRGFYHYIPSWLL